MRGAIIALNADGTTKVHELKSSNPDVTLPLLNRIVGGHIEGIGYLDYYVTPDGPVKCVAFCNEEGKIDNLPVNMPAQLLYELNLKKQGRPINDILVGNIAICVGDDEFLQGL